jgi:hypothetical protein
MLPEPEWRRFVEGHPAANVFHTPEMFQVFSRTRGYRPELWAATRDGHVLALLLAVQITLANVLFRCFTRRAVVYGGVLCTPEIEGQEALARLLGSYTRDVGGAPLFTELRNVSDARDLQPVLGRHGFTYEEHLNYLIDLNQPEEAIWSKVSKKLRQNVRRARATGVTIEDVTEPSQLAVAYRLLEQVFERVHVPLPSITLFQAAFEILTPRDMLKVVLARLGDHYIGVNMALMYRGRIIDWYCASDHAFHSHYPEPLMLWHIIQWGKERSFRVLDFGGAGKPNVDYGPRVFKSKWGGTLVNYGRNTYIHAPIRLRFSRVGYQLLRRFL